MRNQARRDRSRFDRRRVGPVEDRPTDVASTRHEKFGEQSQEIEVKPREIKDISLTFK